MNKILLTLLAVSALLILNACQTTGKFGEARAVVGALNFTVYGGSEDRLYVVPTSAWERLGGDSKWTSDLTMLRDSDYVTRSPRRGEPLEFSGTYQSYTVVVRSRESIIVGDLPRARNEGSYEAPDDLENLRRHALPLR